MLLDCQNMGYSASLTLIVSHACSLVPRLLLPDFISQPWRKIRKRPGIKTVTDWKWWTRLVRNVDGPPFLVHDIVLIPGLFPIFLHGCKIKSGSGLGTRLPCLYTRF